MKFRIRRWPDEMYPATPWCVTWPSGEMHRWTATWQQAFGIVLKELRTFREDRQITIWEPTWRDR